LEYNSIDADSLKFDLVAVNEPEKSDYEVSVRIFHLDLNVIGNNQLCTQKRDYSFGKVVLSGINVDIKPRKLVALMGGSGSGWYFFMLIY
jgi:ABC-type multidrug transport system fused ATPase/permease subunit